MIEISSESTAILDFIRNRSYSKITLDIETLDSAPLKLWNEPIVSFSLSFVPDIPLPIVTNFPTFGFCIQSTDEEKTLLLKLKEIFNNFDKAITILGHNVSYEVECKDVCGFSNSHGYDIPKILKRSRLFGIDLHFIKEFETYDTMDIAFFKMDHEEHGKINRIGKLKKILKCDELEEFFNIERPQSIPKLGPLVRDYFAEKKYKEILLYNCSDTIIETIIYRIFEHKLNFCKQESGLISFKNNCEHIPKIIRIDKLETWKTLVTLGFMKV